MEWQLFTCSKGVTSQFLSIWRNVTTHCLRFSDFVCVNVQNKIDTSTFSFTGFISVDEDEIKRARDYAKMFGPGMPLPDVSGSGKLCYIGF